LAGAVVAVIAPGELNRQAMITVAAVTAYLAWLIVFVLVVERWLRRLTELLFGITIEREFHRLGGPSSNTTVLDGLFLFSWTVVEPASLSLRFAVGLLRFTFSLLALTLPIVFAIILYFGFIARSLK
jgi:hypothetical protein